MVWYFHLLRNFPQCVVIYTVKGFGIVNKAEVDVFLELSCFLDDPVDVGNLPGSGVDSPRSLRDVASQTGLCHTELPETLAPVG